MSLSKDQIGCDYDNLKSNFTLIRSYHHSINRLPINEMGILATTAATLEKTPLTSTHSSNRDHFPIAPLHSRSTVWPPTCSCAKPYHSDNDSHGELPRSCKALSSRHPRGLYAWTKSRSDRLVSILVRMIFISMLDITKLLTYVSVWSNLP